MDYGHPIQADNFESISIGNGTNDPNFNGNNPTENIDTSNWDVSPTRDSQTVGSKVKTLSEVPLPMPGDRQNTPITLPNNPYSVELFELGKAIDYDQTSARNSHLRQTNQANDIGPIKNALETSRDPIKITKNLNESGISEVEKVKRELASNPNPDYGTIYDEIRGVEGMLDEAMQSFGDNSAWQPTDVKANRPKEAA